jgi:hypothetical protein
VRELAGPGPDQLAGVSQRLATDGAATLLNALIAGTRGAAGLVLGLAGHETRLEIDHRIPVYDR